MANSLSKYFIGVGLKRISQVEIDNNLSNQHEFNGSKQFRELLGDAKRKFSVRFIYLPDEEEKAIEEDGLMTWYDARENHATRTEYRLYYSENQAISQAKPNDLVVIGKISNDNLAVVVAPAGSTSEKQLLWLFDFENVGDRLIFKDLSSEQAGLGYAGKYVLRSLGFDIQGDEINYLDVLLDKFGKRFPPTREFSEFARSTVKEISPIDEPDLTLLAWIEREEELFRALEKLIVQDILKKGFGENGDDVDEFVKFSLSVQNRRKSRAGYSLEHNLAVLFGANALNFAHGAITERNNKPDFLFPSAELYHKDETPVGILTMLGVKTSAKDRWRQVLSEAEKIPNKHLITLEPAISRNQTEDMRANSLQLIVPLSIQSTYHSDQLPFILNLKEFINEVRQKQKSLSVN